MSEDSLLAENEDSTPNNDETPETPESWHLAEGIAGEGERPEWFKADKYKSVAAQAEAYAGLEKKLGGFTGAPEGDYELTFPEGIEGEWLEGDALMDGFQTWARENNLSQDRFTELLHMYVKNEAATLSHNQEAELSQLGPNAKSRLENVGDWGKANLSEAQYEALLAATTTAQGVELVEAMIALSKTPKIPVNDRDLEPSGGPSHADLRARMQDPRYKTDPEFRKETSKLYEQRFGTGPKQRVVG